MPIKIKCVSETFTNRNLINKIYMYMAVSCFVYTVQPSLEKSVIEIKCAATEKAWTCRRYFTVI